MHWLLRPSRLVILAPGLVLLYTLVGFFLVSYLIKAYAIPAVAEKLKRPVLVKEVELNPFTLSLRVTGFEIREADQSALLGFDEFFVNLQASSLIRPAYVFDTIRLTVPYVSARVSKAGRMNLAELVPPDGGSQPAAPPQAEKTPAEIPAIEIGEFEIAQGIVEFLDESKPSPTCSISSRSILCSRISIPNRAATIRMPSQRSWARARLSPGLAPSRSNRFNPPARFPSPA
jgi:hypothetical protein